MTFDDYCSYFDNIVSTPLNEQRKPYTNNDYLDYTKLNWVRMKRWLKTAKLSPDLIECVKKISAPQNWIVITEPWCGDAAQSVPFIELVSRLNPLISVSYELRDSSPFRITSYQTNGGKSIPKLIIKDVLGNDVGIWGPRPENCQKVYSNLMTQNADFEKVKTEIQNWYNYNKGKDIQDELVKIVQSII